MIHLYLFSGDYPYSSAEEMCVPSVNISNYCSPYLDPARSVYTKDGIGGVRRLETILDGESKCFSAHSNPGNLENVSGVVLSLRPKV